MKHDNRTKRTLLNYNTKLENGVIDVNRPLLLCEQIDVDINTFFKQVSRLGWLLYHRAINSIIMSRIKIIIIIIIILRSIIIK
jgi:hypothetical protein